MFMAHLDKALRFKDSEIHSAPLFALDSLLKAQFPNGAFPQSWDQPVEAHPVMKAKYPTDWPRIWPHEAYHKYYTLNDGIAGAVTNALIEAYTDYKDPRYKAALAHLGDFLILAQMPDPQPAWAQQYNFDTEPTWARKFEPPAITGWESQDVIRALMKIYVVTKDPKYLAPIPKALAYLNKNLLPDGRINRYYELQINKLLYMNREPRVKGASNAPGYYYFTYDDTNLPKHYGWKQESFLKELGGQYDELVAKSPKTKTTPVVPKIDMEKQVRQVIADMDDEGRWIKTYSGQRLVGQPSLEMDSNTLAWTISMRI